MMKWSLDSISEISKITKRFSGVDDPDLKGLEDRLQLLDDAYIHIEKCCDTVGEFTSFLGNSLTTLVSSLDNLRRVFIDCDNLPIVRAHIENMGTEYGKWVKAKIDIETSELLRDELIEKRQAIQSLRERISLCDSSCSAFHSMQLQMSRLKASNSIDDSFREEYEKQKIVVEQQKLQLQSDVHFLLEKESPFVGHSLDILMGMMQRSVTHNNSLLIKEPPKYILSPDAPFVEGKEDSEIDFTVSSRGQHILPLSMKKGREIIWSIDTFGNDINLRVVFRSEKMEETVIEPMHRIGGSKGPSSCVRGSFVGTGSGMLELLFDNSYSFFRSKQIHVRLGTVDAAEET